MIRYATPRRRANATREELCARLGLTPQASDQDVETAHEQVVKFLGGAPDSVRQWAEREISAADQAHELICNPAIEPPTGRGRRLRIKRLAVATVVLAAAVGIGVGVYNMGGGQSVPSSSQEATTTPQQTLRPTEQAQVSQLMKGLRAHPKDAATLAQLGNIYFRAGDYEAAGGWMARAVKFEPQNVTARLALGAAQFNLGGAADARKQWLRVISIDPKNIEAYYDLGFLYLSEKSPDMARVKRAWRKVIEIAPNSSAAKSVAAHLKRLNSSKGSSGAASSVVPPPPGSGK